MHLFRNITRTRNGVKLRNKGGLSFTRMRELLLEKLEKLVLTLNSMASTVCDLEEQLQQPMQECLIDYSRDTGVGVVRMPKMGMLKIPSLAGYQSPRIWGCDLRILAKV